MKFLSYCIQALILPSTTIAVGYSYAGTLDNNNDSTSSSSSLRAGAGAVADTSTGTGTDTNNNNPQGDTSPASQSQQTSTTSDNINPFDFFQNIWNSFNIQENPDLFQPSFSLPHREWSIQNRQNRAQNLINTQQQFQNGARFHIINGIDKPLPIWRGPQPSKAVIDLIQTEIVDLGSRQNQNASDIVDTLLAGISTGNIPIDTMDDLANMYHSIEHLIEFPLAAKDWDSDFAFAQNRLTITGNALQAVTSLPTTLSSFDIPTNDLESITGESLTLQDLVEQKRLFEIDLSFAGQYPRRRNTKQTSQRVDGLAFDSSSNDHYVPGAHALFYIDNSDTFMPLAIRIEESNLTYTPKDEDTQWQFAKMAFSAAEINYQQMIHFVLRHMMLEPIRVEMMRHLSTRHPLYALLEHHFKNLFGGTVLGFEVLFQNGTTVDRSFGWQAEGLVEFVADQIGTIDWNIQNLKNRFETNGLMNIPGFKGRDDLLAVRRNIQRFVREYLSDYYLFSNDVRSDFELQNFVSACADSQQGAVIGFPSSMRDLSDVVRMVTDIISSVTVQHHAMNSFTTWHSIAFPLHTPALWAPLPMTKEGSIALRTFLPPLPIMMEVIGLAGEFYRDLSNADSMEQSYSGGVLGSSWSSEGAILGLKLNMRRLSQRIQRRERNQSRPYTLLDPERLPFFIWI